MDKLSASPQNLAELDAQYCFSCRILAERITMKYASRIITSTYQERKEQYAHFAYRDVIDPADDTRFSVIPPGVNRQVFSPTRTAIDVVVNDRIKAAKTRDLPKKRRKLPTVLVSSRLDPKKNIIGVVRAFANIYELRENANLAIAVRTLEDPLQDYSSLTAGERAVMDQIVGLVDDSDLWGVVTSFPINGQAELAAAYRVLAKQYSVFALTAVYEPFGLAPLEAMSCGLPVVVTRNGGPSESMMEGNREFGVLVDPENPTDIAKGILKVVTSAPKWRRYSEAGQARVIDKYTWNRTAERYLDLILEIFQQEQTRFKAELPDWFSDPPLRNKTSLDTLSELYFG